MLRWPLAIALAIPIGYISIRALASDAAFFIMVMLALPLAFAWIAPPGLATLLAVAALRQRAWRRALSCAVLPAAMIAATIWNTTFIHFCNDVADRIHFWVMRPYYLAQIKALPDTGKPKLVVFEWGGMAFSSSYGLVYDESDEVARPDGQQSPEWWARAGGTELSCKDFDVRPAGGHFYYADFPC